MKRVYPSYRQRHEKSFKSKKPKTEKHVKRQLYRETKFLRLITDEEMTVNWRDQADYMVSRKINEEKIEVIKNYITEQFSQGLPDLNSLTDGQAPKDGFKLFYSYLFHLRSGLYYFLKQMKLTTAAMRCFEQSCDAVKYFHLTVENNGEPPLDTSDSNPEAIVSLRKRLGEVVDTSTQKMVSLHKDAYDHMVKVMFCAYYTIVMRAELTCRGDGDETRELFFSPLIRVWQYFMYHMAVAICKVYIALKNYCCGEDENCFMCDYTELKMSLDNTFTPGDDTCPCKKLFYNTYAPLCIMAADYFSVMSAYDQYDDVTDIVQDLADHQGMDMFMIWLSTFETSESDSVTMSFIRRLSVVAPFGNLLKTSDAPSLSHFKSDSSSVRIPFVEKAFSHDIIYTLLGIEPVKEFSILSSSSDTEDQCYAREYIEDHELQLVGLDEIDLQRESAAIEARNAGKDLSERLKQADNNKLPHDDKIKNSKTYAFIQKRRLGINCATVPIHEPRKAKKGQILDMGVDTKTQTQEVTIEGNENAACVPNSQVVNDSMVAKEQETSDLNTDDLSDSLIIDLDTTEVDNNDDNDDIGSLLDDMIN